MLSLGQPAVKEMITEALYPRASATHEGASSGSTRNLELNKVAKQTCDTDAPQLSSVLVPQSVSVYMFKVWERHRERGQGKMTSNATAEFL